MLTQDETIVFLSSSAEELEQDDQQYNSDTRSGKRSIRRDTPAFSDEAFASS